MFTRASLRKPDKRPTPKATISAIFFMLFSGFAAIKARGVRIIAKGWLMRTKSMSDAAPYNKKAALRRLSISHDRVLT